MQCSSTRGVNGTLGLAYSISSHEEQATEVCEPSELMNGPANGNVGARGVYDDPPSSATCHTSKKTLPANGKKTKGRVKIKMEFIDNKLRRYTTFSKRKTGIMKKAYELSTLTGTQVMLLVASETGHVYTFATRKLQPMITSEAGKALIQTCLNSPDPPPGPGSSSLDQRMSATGFEETDLTYSVGDDCDKVLDGGKYSSSPSSPQSGCGSPSQLMRSPSPPQMVTLTDLTPTSHQQQVIASNAGYATILSAAPVQIGGLHASSETAAQSGNSLPSYRLPTQGSAQSFSIAIAGTKNCNTSTSSSPVPTQNAISVVQNSQPNLSLVSGNMVIPAGQTLLQTTGSSSSSSGSSSSSSVQGAFMYHTTQGLVYATPSSLPEGVILNLGPEQSATPQQYITIPVSLSLTPAQQQQLMQVSPATVAATCQVTQCSPAKKVKK